MYECDFCNSESEHLYPVNDGLWALCKVCMTVEYDLIPKALMLKERRKPDDPAQPKFSLAESYSKWLESMLEELEGEEE